MSETERPMVLMTQEEINEIADGINKGLYHPDIWRANFIDRFYPLTKVEFDESEQAMIRQMSHTFGYPREDIVRMAVRDAYFHYIVGGGPG